MGLAEILNRKKSTEDAPLFYNDDIQILNSYVEYSHDNKSLEYMMFELEVMDKTGELRRFHKAIKLVRIIRLPKSAKQSLTFMEMHSQVLSGLWEQGINFITIIANMIKPVPLGLLFLYGIQGVAETPEAARCIADNDFASLTALLQGTYRTLEFRVMNYEEVEWLREKMYNMKHLSVVRGLPKPRPGGADGGNTGMGGKNVNPESQETTEEFIAGMSDKEYVVQILASPVSERALREWLTQTAKEMTRWRTQLQGQKSINFGVSLPIVYAANLGASSGWSHGYSDGESVGFAESHSTSESFSESVSTSHSVSTGASTGHNMGISQSAGISHSSGENTSVSVGHSEGTSHSFNHGESASVGHNRGISDSVGISEGANRSESFSQSKGIS
ncbi:MAG: hypothetical protein GX938_10535, partial [Spirochaetales bacterium]|nr:hypothetical protein [Spirochaetales bacterium]